MKNKAIMEKEILRPMWNSRLAKWRITAKTNNGAGGWRTYGEGFYFDSRAECQEVINRMVEKHPDQFETSN